MPPKAPSKEAPKAPSTSPNTTASQEAKTAELKKQAYLTRFKEIAKEYAQRLPPSFTEQQKVAHLKIIMGKEPHEIDPYIKSLK
jgi:tRNA A37 N6-isopentenylltransferase MiaA